jgi:hypothetical protein
LGKQQQANVGAMPHGLERADRALAITNACEPVGVISFGVFSPGTAAKHLGLAGAATRMARDFNTCVAAGAALRPGPTSIASRPAGHGTSKKVK